MCPSQGQLSRDAVLQFGSLPNKYLRSAPAINIVTNHLTHPQAKYAVAYTFSMHFTLLF